MALAGGSTVDAPREATAPSARAAMTPTDVPARPTIDPARPRELLVRGWVAKGIGDVQLMIASASLEPIAIAAIDPTGMPRNGMVPFVTTFRLPRTASSTRTDLVVVPVDSAGRPLASAETRPVQGWVVELVVR